MIHFFAGDNQYLIKQQISELITPIKNKYGDIAIESLDAEEIESTVVLDSINSSSFLIPQKCVIINNTNNKELIIRLVESKPIDSNIVIVVISKLDKRASYYKLLQKNKNFKLFEQSRVVSLPSWVMKYAKDLGGSISYSTANYLLERVGSNQLKLTKEIEKLILYSNNITNDTINLLTTQKLQATTFQLLEVSFDGQLKNAQNLYRDLKLQKIEPQLIVGAIAWQLHLLVLVKLAGRRSSDEIAQDAKISSYSVKKTKDLANRITMAKLKELVYGASQLDLTIKTKFVEPDQAILLYLAKLA